jgi:putative spermidine/putrescine transport system permease protein
MKTRWSLLLWPPFALCLLLLVGTQSVFLSAGFFKDLGLGLLSPQLTLANYVTVLTDPFYLRSLGLTFYLSAIVVVLTLICAYPVAYVIARMQSRWAMWLLAGIVVSSFITVVIKVLGLVIIFGANGPVNAFLQSTGLVEERVSIVGNVYGVVIGLMHYVIGFMVLMLFSVVQTIPRSLEEAARIHGASRLRVFWRVVLPLSMPGVIAGSLIVFNLCMGALVSAVLLGGGRVLTLPVLIQRSIVLNLEYAMGSALAAVLLVSVLFINIVSVVLLRRLRITRLAT